MKNLKNSGSIRVRRSNDRGFEDFGWTDNWMTFSFANYYDPEWVHFGPIRVIVENHIQPHEGFEAHPHEDMEILTYVSSGTLTHGDNMGNKEGIRAGEMQRLSAGTGIVHSEMNEHDEVEHNIQIWILPDKKGHEPGYEMKRFSRKERINTLQLYVSPDGRDESMRINQDAEIYAGILEQNAAFEHTLDEGRGSWIQVVRGAVLLNDDLQLMEGDGVGISGMQNLKLIADSESEVILFDVAMDFETPYSLG